MMILFRRIIRNIRVFQYSAFQIRRLQSLIFSFFAGKYTSAFLIESSGFKFLVDAKGLNLVKGRPIGASVIVETVKETLRGKHE